MVFVKHNSLKSDTFFNPIFIPGFSGSRVFRVRVQGPGPGFSSSHFIYRIFESICRRIKVQIVFWTDSAYFLKSAMKTSFKSFLSHCRSRYQRWSVKKSFLEILQNSQENTCARVSFLIKLQALALQLYLRRDCGTGVFL